MDYTAEQINSAFENITPLRSKAMFRFDIDGISSEIVKKYGLDEEKGSLIKTNIILTIIELIPTKDFEQTVIKESGLAYEKSMDLVSDVEKMLLTPIKEKIEDFKNEERLLKETATEAQSKEMEIPLPPYISIEEVPTPENSQNVVEKNELKPIEEKIPEPVAPKTEEGIYEKSGIEMMPDEILPNTEASEKKIEEEIITEEKETTKKEDNILMDSGINVVKEVPLPKEESVIPTTETEQVMMDSVEHPESIARNILMNKLKGSSVSETTVSDYSLPKMSTDKHESTGGI